MSVSEGVHTYISIYIKKNENDDMYVNIQKMTI